MSADKPPPDIDVEAVTRLVARLNRIASEAERGGLPRSLVATVMLGAAAAACTLAGCEAREMLGLLSECGGLVVATEPPPGWWADGFTAGLKAGMDAERAAIVRWLREQARVAARARQSALARAASLIESERHYLGGAPVVELGRGK